MSRLPPLLLAFEHRNFRLYAFGQSVSLMGTWLQRVAMGWLAYRLSGSVWLLGLVGFCGQAAVFFIAPFAGILGDRGDKRRLITLLQYIMLGQALLLSALAWSELIQAWHLVILALVLGIASAFDAPLRQALLFDLIEDKTHLSNAIALNSLLVNLARMAGPALAGFIVAAHGEALCFALNTLSFIAIIIALSRMQWRETTAAGTGQIASYWASFIDGSEYAWRNTHIRNGLILVGAVSWCISPYVTLMPVFVKEVFDGNANMLGNLLAASGAGTILATLYLAGRRSIQGLNSIVAGAAGLSGLGMCLFAWCSSYVAASILLAFAGGGMMVAAAGTNTIIQTLTEPKIRGRIASFYIMSFIGIAPFGTLAASLVTDVIGVRSTFFFNGALCCLTALWFKWRAGNGTFS